MMTMTTDDIDEIQNRQQKGRPSDIYTDEGNCGRKAVAAAAAYDKDDGEENEDDEENMGFLSTCSMVVVVCWLINVPATCNSISG